MQSRTKRKPQEPKVSYHKKPEHLTVQQWQRELRKAFVREGKQSFTIEYLAGEHPVFADYSVANLENKRVYKVALRSRTPGSNFCTCLDFKTNALGTCKHVEAVLQRISKNKKLAPMLLEVYTPPHSSLFVHYGQKREVTLRIGVNGQEQFEQLARTYCDRAYRLLQTSFDRIDRFLEQAKKINAGFRCYEDALEFIIATRQQRARKAMVTRKIVRNKTYFDRLLKIPLYPFQQEGIVFAVKAGRCLIADDMGLGKTLEAIGVAEVLRKECGIARTLIVCPTSLKYQWKSEIEKCTESKAVVVEGNALARQRQYASDTLYTIASYNVVGADIAAINNTEFDLVILDEAQRIKNWKTKTAHEVKKIISPYAVVLTGTPIENKLEELYSIVQFIDPFALGPLYKFLEEHQIRDASSKVIGYQELNKIRELLSDIVIRRTKKEVLKQLPTRTDKQLFVPLTKEQADMHQGYAEIVSRLVSKWKRLGFLDEKDRQRLLLALNCMRMVADSTYILDQQTRYDTKIAELMCILDNVLSAGEEKVVVFSQWERMTRLVAAELERRKIGFAYLHGGVPSKNRKDLSYNFHNDHLCRIFLSTDAGSVGLNLQCASTIINMDLPWNPAVLEQRIGRIHRHGQRLKVTVINLISRDSIEERMLSVLKFKSSLFAGALDGGEDQIFMGEDRFKQFMHSVEHITSVPQPTPVTVTDVEIEAGLDRQTDKASTGADKQVFGDEMTQAASDLFKTLTTLLTDKKKTETVVSSFVQKDAQTGKPYLKIPLENEQLVSNALNALQGLFSVFNK